MSLFPRVIQHLLPDARAWRLNFEKTLKKYVDGLGESLADARAFLDEVYLDRFAVSTRELTESEFQLGLVPPASAEEARRLNLAAARQATGGQSPRYLQDIVQAAGFDVYVHEWWEPPNEAPRVVRNPRDYTEDPTFGTTQCGEPEALCGEPAAQCNRFLANEPGYLVNSNLTREAPPLIPDDPAVWPHFVYFGAETFGDVALVDAARRQEFETLLLKLCPDDAWIVTLVEYLSEVIDDNDDAVIDDSGDTVMA